jgi:FKBP-type peptidyl-prolyl cis-trans isomerase FkpA
LTIGFGICCFAKNVHLRQKMQLCDRLAAEGANFRSSTQFNNSIAMRKLFFLIIAASTLFYTCNKEDQAEIDRNLILNYLEENNLTADEDDSGLFYIINQPGDDRRPGLEEKVTLTYVGTYLDGDTIGRVQTGFTDPLNRLIVGFQEGLPYIGRGGNITLIIPSGLAFGSNPPIGIRSNAVVRYDVSLEEDQDDVDRQILLDYLDENELTTLQEHPSGIFYEITAEGDGDNPTLEDRVSVEYRGTLLDGTEFDATEAGNPVSFPLMNLIEGWQIAIPLLSRGGEGIFYIPSQLCYGSYPPSSDIPRNAILRFEIKLIGF